MNRTLSELLEDRRSPSGVFNDPVGRRASALFREHSFRIHSSTDRLFTFLLVFEWFAAIVAALVVSPRAWAGMNSQVHPHVWAAIGLGFLVISLPVFRGMTRAGEPATRHLVAIAQMLMGALLIHLTGGRIETHFHVFGSLALIAFYRDWRVLVSASAVVAADHLFRGIFWPQSVFGVLFPSPWRWAEHVAWVCVEDVFLIGSCLRGTREMWDVAARQALLEAMQEGIEQTVFLRTEELERANASLVAEVAERTRAENALRDADSRMRSMVDHVAEGIITIDERGVIDSMNLAARRIFLLGDLDMVGRKVSVLMPEPYRTEHAGYLAEFLRTGESRILGQVREVVGQRCDGSTFPMDLAISEFGVNGRRYFTGIVRDITERKRAAEQLAASEERYRLLVEGVADYAIFMLSPVGHIESWNAGAERLHGYREEEAVDQPLGLIYTEAARANTDLARAIAAGRFEEECWLSRKDGSRFWASIVITALFTADRRLRGFAYVTRDVTERRHTQELLAHQATHDSLTGLPNRALLLEHITQSVDQRPGQEGPFALLLLDLDRFKEINDTFGHHHGDGVLRMLSPILLRSVRERDTVARLGGDEFGILLRDATASVAAQVAERILWELRQPFLVEGQALEVGGSIGIALFPEHSRLPAELMQFADVAMYAAKRGKSGYQLYSEGQSDFTPRRLALISELRHGIEAGELRVHYQPKIDLRTDAVEGVEALVRWNHPREGLLKPGQFIDLAAETTLLKPLSVWVLRAAMDQCRVWHRSGLNLRVAVNLGAELLRGPELVGNFARLLEASDALPEWLTLEITESAMMADPARASETLSCFRAMGVRVSIDDFGTGYSSLAYLRDFPADEVKIDRSFVTGFTHDRSLACIVRTVISLGHNLGLRVVAEGVEDRTTAAELAGLGCDLAQGYYYSEPLPAAELADWIRSRRLRPLRTNSRPVPARNRRGRVPATPSVPLAPTPEPRPIPKN